MNIYLQQIQENALSNKYTKWYVSLCNNALLRSKSRKEAKQILGYTEGHHIITKSMNISFANKSDNIVYFSPKEHYIAHHLLANMFDKSNRVYYKLLYAFDLLSKTRKIYAYQYNKRRIELAQLISINTKGLKRTKQSIEKQKQSIKNSDKIREANKIKGNKRRGKPGHIHYESTKKTISKKLTGRKLSSENIIKRNKTRREKFIGYKKWKITNAISGVTFIIHDLPTWRTENNIRQSSLSEYYRKSLKLKEHNKQIKPFKGIWLIEEL